MSTLTSKVSAATLAAALATHAPQFEALAAAWMASGASAYTVCGPHGSPVVWPAGGRCPRSGLMAGIYHNRQLVGELRVAGVDSEHNQIRLNAEAQLVEQLVTLSGYLDIVTSELINKQDQLLAVYDLARAGHDSLDLDSVLRQLAHKAARLVNAEGSVLVLQMNGTEPISVHYPRRMVDDQILYYALDIMQTTQRKMLLSENDLWPAHSALRNLLLFPLHIRGVRRAALGLLNKVGSEFLMPDVKLVEAISQHVSARIENLLLYTQTLDQTRLQTEIDLAQRVQSNLLPHHVPQVRGLDLWAASHPAHQVGGDFYDFLDRPGRPFTFAVGDVSGKGLPAALLMAMTRMVIRAKSGALPNPMPNVVLAGSNEELYEDFTGVNMFATVFVGQYDNARRELLFANAGHSPVIYRPAQGGARLLQADSTALGILPTSRPANQQVRMHTGDVMVVGTDGLNEAHNDHKKMFGYDKLLQLVDTLADASAQDIARGLYQAVHQFSAGQPQDDDQTLMVLKGVAV
jgi:phosphoserine phosphatase RsbU/P